MFFCILIAILSLIVFMSMSVALVPYVFLKFVWQEAVRIYNIPWPPKKIAAQISYQGCLPKTAQICAASTANWPKLPKNELQKNIRYVL